MVEWISEHWDEASVIVLAALGLFSAIARVTPNESDNKVVDWIWKLINKLGLRGGPTT